MYIAQSDLFHGMDKEFVKEIMDLAIREDYEREDFLFRKGDPADHFYVLLKGHILLSPDETGEVIHSVSHAGESFGWSSLVGSNAYTASAQCQVPARVLKFNAQQLRQVLEKDPAHGLIFYRRLAATLGERLVQSYQAALASSRAQASVSFGTRELVEAAELT